MANGMRSDIGTGAARAPRDWVLVKVRDVIGVGAAPGDPVDLQRTCERLLANRSTAASTYAHALALGLAQALGTPPRIGAPDAPDLSFDEAWLMRLLERAQMRDAESVGFLIASRVAPRHRACFAFLVKGLAARLPERPRRAVDPADMIRQTGGAREMDRNDWSGR